MNKNNSDFSLDSLKSFIESKGMFESKKPPTERDLNKEDREAKHEQKQKTRNLIFNVIRFAIIFVSFLGGIAIFILSFHILMPQGWRWLEEADITKLKDVITYSLSGFVVGILNKFSKDMEEEDNQSKK
jgi:hypothetical protein